MDDVIFVNGVSYTRTDVLNNENTNESRRIAVLDEVKRFLNCKLDEFQSLTDGYKSEGLSYSGIESEGGVRALKIVLNELQWLYPYEF